VRQLSLTHARIRREIDHLSSPRTSSFVVEEVHRNPDVVDLSPLKGSAKLDLVEKGIPWTTLTYLDELNQSQNALRVVREATED
jgi:hypothetical protein